MNNLNPCLVVGNHVTWIDPQNEFPPSSGIIKSVEVVVDAPVVHVTYTDGITDIVCDMNEFHQATRNCYKSPSFEEAKSEEFFWANNPSLSFDGHYWTIQTDSLISRIVTKEQALEVAELWAKWDAEEIARQEDYLLQESEL